MKKDKEIKYPCFYAAQSKDKENVEKSSSGGIFFELCRSVIAQRGVIYGAASISPIGAEHLRAYNLSQASAFRRSKYIQSQNHNCFEQVKIDLESGRIVLFSGVGCQIAGLIKYLGEQYDNLLTCEVVCHGMPLTEAIEKYIAEKEINYGERLVSVNFRDKRYGWKYNCIAEYYESGRCELSLSSEHPVHSLYLKGINMQTRCASCKYAKLPRIADITLADFWKYEGDISHGDRGMSLVSVNTEKGEERFEKIKQNIFWEWTTENIALASCRHMANAPLGHRSHEAFRHLLAESGFTMAYGLCNSFGEIVMPENLQILEDISANRVLEIFEIDTQEIVYVVDSQKRVKGIITFGAFLFHYSRGENWINVDFFSVNLNGAPIHSIKEIFAENEKINRIPILDETGTLLYEVRRYEGVNGRNDSKKMLIPFARLNHNHNKCLFVKRPDLLSDMGKYKKKEIIRIENQISFPVMQADWDKYQDDFQDIFGKTVTKDYIDALCLIPPIVMYGQRCIHSDGCSQYVNIVNGVRMTVGQPENYDFTIHMYGRCGVFGYAVEDGDTMPSALQAILNERGRNIRVENHGLWGADDEKILKNISVDLEEGVISQEDIVIVYMDYLPWMEEIEKFSVKYFDTTTAFHKFLEKGTTFFDKPGHMTAEGYTFIAQYLYQKLEETDCLNCFYQKKRNGSKIQYNNSNLQNMNEEMKNFLKETKKKLPVDELGKSKVGAIVMNCNPFTNGHRYLIEQALKHVEILIIFVLEENKSYFSFEDRFRMVQMGTQDLERVYVVPSGKFIISALTFPEYFLKEQQPDMIIRAADDVSLFGKYIAPAFHILIRFVGTEPTDKVTAQYNEQLKKILPLYGVELYEIPRLKKEGNFVTATEVRRCMELHDFTGMADLVPVSTWKYLKREEG